ncbi:MAG: 3-deoxy-manno-octulosonate cytidylyltransferase [Alphaproteobacteria bacterium]
MEKVPQSPILIIPARMTSTRLPGKPLADIHGQPMIVHVWKRAMASKVGPVLVACDTNEIVDVIKKAGGMAVLTKPDHPSGSDRIWEALHAMDGHARYDAIINVQGDEPLLNPDHIRTAFDLLKNPGVDISTLAAVIDDEQKKIASQVVKAAIDCDGRTKQGRALYFSRHPIPSGEGPVYHHVGLYAYRREALAAFVAAPPSPLELREKLEQLRALSLGMHIEVGVIDSVPMGVDTPEDLEKARKLLKP